MPTNRRSTISALTSEQQAFLKPPDLPLQSQDGAIPTAFTAAERPVKGRASRSRAPAPKSCLSSAAGKRGLALHSVTLRLTPAAVRALRRAAAERSLDYEEPFSQQAIVEAALREWLTRNGIALADAGG